MFALNLVTLAILPTYLTMNAPKGTAKATRIIVFSTFGMKKFSLFA